MAPIAGERLNPINRVFVATSELTIVSGDYYGGVDFLGSGKLVVPGDSGGHVCRHRRSSRHVLTRIQEEDILECDKRHSDDSVIVLGLLDLSH